MLFNTAALIPRVLIQHDVYASTYFLDDGILDTQLFEKDSNLWRVWWEISVGEEGDFRCHDLRWRKGLWGNEGTSDDVVRNI